MRRFAPVLVLTAAFALTVSALPALPAMAAPGTPGGSAAAAPPVRQAREIRSMSTSEYGAPAPTGVAYSPADGRLLVTGADEGGLTRVLSLPPAGRDARTVRLPSVVGGASLAFDPVTGLLTAVERGHRVGVSLATPTQSRETALPPAVTGEPRGATYDPAGTWFVLDEGRLVRVRPGPGSSGEVTTLPLVGLGGASLRGLAYNPRDGLLYTAEPSRQLLHALTVSGALVRSYDMSDAHIRSLQGMVFAPTADRTDDPAETNLFVADAGDATSSGRISEVSLTAAVTAAAASLTATLVRTTATSAWSPSSPDPSGITVLPDGRLLVVDGEVDEMSIFQNVNAWVVSRDGATVSDRGVTTRFTKEPTGAAYDPRSGHVFTSDDDASRVYDVTVGPDGRYGTADDTWQIISTSPLGSGDAEDVTVDTRTGELFVIDGVNAEVYELSPGPNGRFDGLAPGGDDTTRHFDVGGFGATDPEGIYYDATRDTLFVVSSNAHAIFELTTGGALLNVIDIKVAGGTAEAGVVRAAASSGSGMSFYVVDRRVDNNSNASENDGRMYELSAPLPAVGNVAPTVLAGPDLSVVQPAAASLAGSVTDDGLPNPPGAVTSQWSTVSGPGTVTFANSGSPATTATFSEPGTYVLQLTGSDGDLSVSDQTTVTVTGPNGPFALSSTIATGADDVEEAAGGSVSVSSSDLELVNDGSDQTVGLRYRSVGLPRGAVISSATVQFTVDEATTGATSLTIRGQAADNAAAFTTTSGNVSTRPRTAAAVGWVPAGWPTAGAAGPDQRTPDLSAVLQEIVNRSGWASGNALALVITGTGRRTAESFEGGAPPVLRVSYLTSSGGTTNQAPTVNAGQDQTVTLPAAATLSGSAGDDGLPTGSTLTTTWTTQSGPGTVTFGNDHALSTTATFSTSGTYTLRLSATDGTLTSTDDVTITVNPAPPPGTGQTLDVPVRASSDDAEQSSSGSMSLTSTDLELVTDGTTVQTVGVRFTGLAIPRGAVVTRAYVQFSVDEVSTDACSLTVAAQAADNAATFTTTKLDVTNRPLTAAVPWTPPPWPTRPATTADQRTPDLSALVQQVVDRAGWNSGQAMAFVFKGSGRRTAASFDGTRGAPVLHLEFHT